MSTETSANVQTPVGCTLSQYSEIKRLPIVFLRQLGLTDAPGLSPPAVRIPYLDPAGAEIAVRFRLAMGKADGSARRFRWTTGSKPCPYGLWRLDGARSVGCVVLVEGESDAQTLWYCGIPALGIPGAATWKDAWAQYMDGIPTIHVVIEADRGGETLLKRIAGSALRDKVRLIRQEGAKDPSELYVQEPESFLRRWGALEVASAPLKDELKAEIQSRAKEARKACAELLSERNLLARFARELEESGVVGEAHIAQLVYLCLTTRVFDRPVSAVLKGPSSAGKSYLLEGVLKFFPPRSYFVRSSMSEHALIYSKEPLAHRFLVLYEAQGLRPGAEERGNILAMVVRSLLSEGRIKYETVIKTERGPEGRLIEREGPTGLLMTTTAVRLHPENETRTLSITVKDTQEQTRAVMRVQARGGRAVANLEQWHALQETLESEDHRVAIPFAAALAELVPPVAVRMRRDFEVILGLIRAHALLHCSNRGRDETGQILAEIDDYSAVRSLVADLVAEAAEVTVSKTIRQTVEAVSRVISGGATEVTVVAIARELKLDSSSAWRRVQAAIQRGFLRNNEDRPRQAARIVLADPLPEQLVLLPSAEAVRDFCDCMIAGETQGDCVSKPTNSSTCEANAFGSQPDGGGVEVGSHD